ncbi:MAG: WD40 repeat domain-containing protein [Spirochaetota bacterium]
MSDVDFSLLNRELLTELSHVVLDDYIIDLAWSPDTTRLAAITVEGEVFLIATPTTSAQSRLMGQHAGGGNSLSWRCDGAEFATAGHDGLVKIWDGNSGQELDSLEAGSSWVSKVSYNPNSNVLASAAGKHLKVWNEKREVFYESSRHSSTIADLAWNSEGSKLAAAAYHGVTLHEPGIKQYPRKYYWNGSSLALAWSPDSKFIATGEQDASVHFWYVESGDDSQMEGFPSKVQELSWDPSGQWLATSGGGTICLWDCSGDGPEGRQPKLYEAHPNKLTQIAFQSDGELLVSTDVDSLVFVWEPMQHNKVIGASVLTSAASCLRWCKGNRFAVGQEDGKVVIFEVRL